MKKAIKIDVEKRTITEVLMDGKLNCITKEIGNNCEYFCCPISLPNDDSIYCDDEILLRIEDIKGGFKFKGWERPIVNNAIILGTDSEGDSVDYKTDIGDLKDVIFLDELTAKDYAIKTMKEPIKIFDFKPYKF